MPTYAESNAIILVGTRTQYDAFTVRFSELAERGLLERVGRDTYRMTDRGAAALAAMAARPRTYHRSTSEMMDDPNP